MPMTTRQYVQIKKNLELWHIVEPEHTDVPVLIDLFREIRSALQQLIDAQEEATPSLLTRIKRLFGG